MIDVAGCVFTDPSETHDLHEFFFNKYGKDVQTPSCNFCGKTTCYIVEEAKLVRGSDGKARGLRPVKKGVSMVFRIAKPALLYKDDKIHFPVLQCCDCEARYDATMAFKTTNLNPPNLDSRCMTQTEKERYRMIFRAKISDLEKERNSKPSMGNKYAPGDR